MITVFDQYPHKLQLVRHPLLARVRTMELIQSTLSMIKPLPLGKKWNERGDAQLKGRIQIRPGRESS